MDYFSVLRNKRLLRLKLLRGRVRKETLHKGAPIDARFGFFLFGVFGIAGAVLYGLWFAQYVDPNYGYGKIFIDIPLYPITMRGWFIIKHSFWYGLSCSILFTCAYFLLPVYVFFMQWFKTRKIPPRTIFCDFTVPYRMIFIMALAAVLVYLLNFKPLAYYHREYLIRHGFTFSFWLTDFHAFVVETSMLAVVLFVCIFCFMPKHSGKYKAGFLAKVLNFFDAFPFSLYLGESTGILIDRKHKAGIAPKQAVNLRLEDAAQNIIAFGGIGEGKTTAVIYPLLIQLLEQNCGGVVCRHQRKPKNPCMAIYGALRQGNDYHRC